MFSMCVSLHILVSRFDIVMDDHLMDEVFARFDPEGSGKVRSRGIPGPPSSAP